jgi:hypothetical protein
VGGVEKYEARVFDVSLLSETNYLVEPQSLQFLREHGFNFNHQISQGTVLGFKPNFARFSVLLGCTMLLGLKPGHTCDLTACLSGVHSLLPTVSQIMWQH